MKALIEQPVFERLFWNSRFDTAARKQLLYTAGLTQLFVNSGFDTAVCEQLLYTAGLIQPFAAGLIDQMNL